jgi:hypothetical protein
MEAVMEAATEVSIMEAALELSILEAAPEVSFMEAVSEVSMEAATEAARRRRSVNCVTHSLMLTVDAPSWQLAVILIRRSLMVVTIVVIKQHSIASPRATQLQIQAVMEAATEAARASVMRV